MCTDSHPDALIFSKTRMCHSAGTRQSGAKIKPIKFLFLFCVSMICFFLLLSNIIWTNQSNQIERCFLYFFIFIRFFLYKTKNNCLSGHSRTWTRGLPLAKGTLYQLSYMPSSFCSIQPLALQIELSSPLCFCTREAPCAFAQERHLVLLHKRGSL